MVLELGITKQEAVDGFRYLPEDVKLTNSEGEFLPSVVGLRALLPGEIVSRRLSIESATERHCCALCETTRRVRAV